MQKVLKTTEKNPSATCGKVKNTPDEAGISLSKSKIKVKTNGYTQEQKYGEGNT